jgi:hypothetical protein
VVVLLLLEAMLYDAQRAAAGCEPLVRAAACSTTSKVVMVFVQITKWW